MRIRSLVCALVLLAVMPGSAAAHHHSLQPRRDDSAAAGGEGSSAGVSATTTQVGVDDEQGRFYTVAAELYLRLGARWALTLRAPVHHLEMDGAGAEDGVGDLGVGVRASAALAGWDGSAGVDLLLPTGDAALGLGHGDLTAAVGAQLTHRLGRGWRAGGQLVALADLTDRDPGTTVVIEHRSDAELRAAALASWTGSQLRAGGELRLVAPLAPSASRGHLYPTAAAELAMRTTDRTWLGLSAEIPLSSARQLDWQAGLALAYQFDDG
ncbi:MAG TPA: hypothetical protein VL172_17510 [Kofleriaceae bacterium]|nr:hypothetical protein [Kofleriaceae bacterium]